ncbi:hypothetical protein Cni_G12955 [Canna indica]|uniref:Uncharacterized protein n=1 Tax=Canna indica TaxID=4628 RepID=A0AAQ3KAG0_9LILI|nr:hypothetical protein Cni_G12955 [Canna indica]
MVFNAWWVEAVARVSAEACQYVACNPERLSSEEVLDLICCLPLRHLRRLSICLFSFFCFPPFLPDDTLPRRRRRRRYAYRDRLSPSSSSSSLSSSSDEYESAGVLELPSFSPFRSKLQYMTNAVHKDQQCTYEKQADERPTRNILGIFHIWVPEFENSF